MGGELRVEPAHVRVPATSANLGPGFDALGLALTWYDDVFAQVADDDLTVEVAGEGADEVPRSEQHLVVRAMRVAFDRLGVVQPRGLGVRCINRIPHGRGLGSSAAAIVAGILAARALTVSGVQRLGDQAVVELAAQLEGHPDNVAACVAGGLSLAWSGPDGRARFVRLAVVAGLAPVVFLPTGTSSTALARRLLPESVPYADATHNAARAALLVEALRGRPEFLLEATEDRLHQGYRAPAMPGTVALMAELRAGGVPAVVSGAGPAVLALTTTGMVECAVQLAGDWQVRRIGVDRLGATVLAVPD